MQIKKLPKVAVVATKLIFLQHFYRVRINHKTLYSQTFPGPLLAPGLHGDFLITIFCGTNIENLIMNDKTYSWWGFSVSFIVQFYQSHFS